MHLQDRLDDIVKRTGLSEDIIRRVLKASQDSLLDSMMNGENATLPGLCTFIPQEKQKFGINLVTESYVKIKVNPSNSMIKEFERRFEDSKNVEKIEETKLTYINPQIPKYNTVPRGARIGQIEALL